MVSQILLGFVDLQVDRQAGSQGRDPGIHEVPGVRIRGFSMGELLIGVALILLLASLLSPLLVRAKWAAKRSVCEDKLRQLQYALCLYRSEEGGDGVFGPAELMGLPPDILTVRTRYRLPETLGRCGGYPDARAGAAVFQRMFDISARDPQGRWARYVQSALEGAVIIIDTNHDRADSARFSPFYTHSAFGVNLSGSLVFRRRVGDPRTLDFWSGEWR
jgi:type II secretory pathway pseudopilin PulG